jgi:tryptophanyl-tRNA synthetase
VFDPASGEVEALKERYRRGKVGDVDVKARLAGVLNEYLAPLRQRRFAYAARRDELIEILYQGTQAAMPLAMATLEEVELRMGLNVLRSSQSAVHHSLFTRR